MPEHAANSLLAVPRRVGPPGLHARRVCRGAERRPLDLVRLDSAMGSRVDTSSFDRRQATLRPGLVHKSADERPRKYRSASRARREDLIVCQDIRAHRRPAGRNWSAGRACARVIS
jgi:hypothetical protein